MADPLGLGRGQLVAAFVLGVTGVAANPFNRHVVISHKLVEPLANEMGDAYPELVKAKDHVEKVLELMNEPDKISLDIQRTLALVARKT